MAAASHGVQGYGSGPIKERNEALVAICADLDLRADSGNLSNRMQPRVNLVIVLLYLTPPKVPQFNVFGFLLTKLLAAAHYAKTAVRGTGAPDRSYLCWSGS